MPADAATSSPSVPSLQHRIAVLEAQLHERAAAHDEAVRQQIAAGEVLQVINASAGHLQPVFDTIIDKAMTLCGAAFGIFGTFDGERIRTIATRGVPEAFVRFRLSNPPEYGPETGPARLIAGEAFVHIIDVADSEAYRQGDPNRRAVVDLGGARTILSVALRKDDAFLGTLSICRQDVRPFSDNQIALLQGFAAQAVIAMENARLLTEQREALERQTATAEVLQIINSSPGQLAPVFEAILEKAHNLCETTSGSLHISDGEKFRAVAVRGISGDFADRLRRAVTPGPKFPVWRLIAGERYIQIANIEQVDDLRLREAAELGGFRTVLFVPLRKEQLFLGYIVASRKDVRLFSDKQITLLENFAAQAVIAMENARLLTEQREALDQQTATAEVLQVINSSPGDIGPVFETILEKAHALCDVAFGSLELFDGTRFRAVASRKIPEPLLSRLKDGFEPGPNHPLQRLLAGADHVQVADMAKVDDPIASVVVQGGHRTVLSVALRKDGELLGRIVSSRIEVRPFMEKEIALLESFAAQAVIAMENARLLTEQREALERQTATAEVLQVINSSPGDIVPVFETILEKAHALCGVAYGSLQLYDGEKFRAVAVHGLPQALADELRAGYVPGPTHPVRPLLAGEDSLQIPDMAGLGGASSALRSSGLGTALFVALRKDELLLGQIVATRDEVRPFTNKETSLLQNFAQQAVIAMENARLLGDLRQRTDDLTESLEYQTATSELLEVISRSASDIQPVLDTMLGSACRLCDVQTGSIAIRQGDAFRSVAMLGLSVDFERILRERPLVQDRGSVVGRVLLDKVVCQIPDVEADPDYNFIEAARLYRSVLGVPLLKDGEPLGVIVLSREKAIPFTERQIALIETFADQAVIAMENARLLSELTRREQELSVTFEHMGDGVVMFDADLRIASWNLNFQKLLEVPDSFLVRRPALEDYVRLLVERGEVGHGNADEEVVRYRERASQTWSTERTRPDGKTIEVRNNPIPGGGAVLIYGDITERKKAEAEIAAARDAAEVALERQTATADILKVIASSPTDVQPVLDAIAKAAQRFCGAADALISLREGDEFIRAAHEGSMPSVLGRSPLDRSSVSGRSILEGRTIHIPDIGRLDREDFPSSQTLAASSGARAALAAPMSREGSALGCILLRRASAGSFAPTEIELLEAFAAQAVIAIENVRLFNELQSSNDGLKEALDKQTATSEILRVISGSPTNVEPVFRTILANANTLCDASFSLLWLWEGEALRVVAHEHVNVSPKLAEFIATARPRPHRHTPLGLSVLERTVVHVEDVLADPRFVPEEVPIYRLEGARSILAVPMVREGTLVGVINIWRREPGAFTDGQKALVQTFADQAVIAIENARLFTELREALEQQTATSDILRVISQSPTDVMPVLTAVARAALKFCGARDAQVVLRDGDTWSVVAHEGPIGALSGKRRLNRETAGGRAMVDGDVVQIHDLQSAEADEFQESRELGRRLGFRSALAAPLLRDDVPIGAIGLRRPEAGAFTPNQVELLKSFAAQAVIAIENVRLFTELRDALEQQTATAEILRVISQSPTDVGPVLTAVARAALKFCNARDALVALRDGDSWVVAAHEGPIEAPAGLARPLNRASVPGRAILDGDVVQVTDFQSAEADEFPLGREISALRGFRAALAAPLLLDKHGIGAISLRRTEPGAFTSNQVELLKSFAAQAVIAIENVRLFSELRDSLERLKAAQANLIQAEKMASLGQLTAGIAHEIKNPLNFVNNFAGLSNELLDELKQAVDPLLGNDDDKRAEVQETMELLNSNLAKIVEHGRRADGIVKSMLAHSRGGTGDWQTSNINGLAEEALNLAYHGARAHDQSFNVTLERDFDPALTPIDVVPQDVTRVFLNLFANGFYATCKRQREDGEGGYQPTLKVSTRDRGGAVEIQVRDNGIGIAPEVRDKLFQPFFTTKPTGEGTGLGLSISYDIVTQQHGGSIEVESEVGQFTEFTVRLPRARRAASGDKR